ncbi:MAG: metallophosphoesterase N-terminal domain-containing protein, partial [Agathobacter sp.]
MKKTLLFLLAIALSSSSSMSKERIRVSGTVVTDKGVGIPGVVVNDGVNFTVTDKSGRWVIETDTTVSKFVSI